MRIVFIGGVQFSELALHRVMKLNAQVVGVCTAKLGQPASDRIDLATVCDEYGLNVRHCDDINDKGTVDWITALAPDVIFCFGWSRLIKAPLLQLPRLGVIGFHPSALPQNRGRHPIIWALALGLTKTASTFFVMDEGADSGPIVSQRPVEIREDDDAATLYQRITDVALEQIEDMVPRLANGTAVRKNKTKPLRQYGVNAAMQMGKSTGEWMRVQSATLSVLSRDPIRALTFWWPIGRSSFGVLR